ncbi:putative Nonribosomal peptide synthetase 1 [Seiridium cardinale]|uniref:Nonribosomal peptide synthetase 1 n=1 Tax=Seiridium cardinale TaxID=138064 RepID=A0ABR2XHX5_9PEZI
MNGDHAHHWLFTEDSIRDKLREIWGEVLEEDPSMFSDKDAFFEVGGDSMLAHEVAVAAEKCGIFLDMPEIFMSTSLKDMADAARPLDAKKVETNGTRHHADSSISGIVENEASLHAKMESIARACDVNAGAIESVYPCSPMQESLMVGFDGTKNVYVMQYVFKLVDDISVDRFRRAWEDTLDSTPVLRTRICKLEGMAGYTQAVITEKPQLETVRAELAHFLESDAKCYMESTRPFFRHTIVADEGDNSIITRYFVWTVHHALCDAVSLEEIVWDTSRRFLDEVPPQRQSFESFIESRFISPSSEEKREHEFWRKTLANTSPAPYPPPPQIPEFEPNPAYTLEGQLTLKQMPPLGVTKALLLRAAWAILASHYTGTEDVGFGTINNGRSSKAPSVSHTTGPTINLVPTALHVDPEQPVASFLTQVKTQAGEMIPFEHAGISKIRRHLLGGDISAVNFQTLFVVQSTALFETTTPALRTLGMEFVQNIGKRELHPFPLVLTFIPTGDTSIKFNIQYDDRVMSSKEASNLVHHFQKVLTQLSQATKETLLKSISPFNDHDLYQIYQWNDFTPSAEHTCIHDLFQDQVSINPSAVAVCSSEQSLTYHDVDQYSSLFASHLIDLGACRGDFIAVCFEKSIWTVVAILAVFKAGGVYVPIDPTQPRGRIQEIVEMAHITTVIASNHGGVIMGGFSVQIVSINGPPSPSWAVQSLPRSTPSDTAYLLFTSGTTGKPKGILMSHSAICTSIINHGPAFGAGPHWRTLQFAAHMFDLSIGEFFTTLAFGGCICIPSEYDRLNNLAGAINALKANTLLVVPTVANLLSPADVPTLRTLVLAGEPITKGTIVKWVEHVKLVAAYGPSETAVWCSGNLDVTSDSHPANIGRSIGASMWIVHPEDYHQLSAIGCVGEIVISGALLGGGYLGNQVTTDAAFVPAPDWLRKVDPTVKTVYKSGDLARYNSDGTFHIVGRTDTQVKLRGFRIELGEVENRIMMYGTVVAVVATLPKTGPCAGQIVAVLSLSKSTLGDSGSNGIPILKDRTYLGNNLKQHLSLILPEYMIPTIFVIVERMPLLISGKIDRKLTKTWIETMSFDTYAELMDSADTDGGAEILPGSLSDTLRHIWSEVLNVPKEVIGLNNSFFAYGGDSIAAIQVVSRAKDIGLHVTVRGILSTKTIGSLSALVEQNRNSISATVENPRSTKGTDDILLPYRQILSSKLADRPFLQVADAYHLSPIQREIMKARALNPDVFLLLLHMEFTALKSQSVSLERLVRSWKRVVQKYPILRTIFLQDPTGHLPPLQVVLKECTPETYMSSATASETEPTFETVGAPPVDECFLHHRAHFYQHGDRFVIYIQFDHLVIDGWSLKLIKTVFLDAYEKDEAYVPQDIAPYKDFVDAHRSDRTQADDNYWASALRDQKPSILSLHVYREDSPEQRLPSKTKSIVYLPHLKVESMTEFSTKHGITPASIFDSAWAQTLSHYTGSTDVAFEYVVSGRDEEVDSVFDIVGPLINVVPYHLTGVSTDNDALHLAQLAQRMQEQRIQDSQHTSSNVREVIESEVRQGPLFNTAVNFQRRPTAVETEKWRLDEDLRKTIDPWHFDVLVRVLHITDDSTFRPSVEFDGNFFNSDDMEDVAKHFWNKVLNTVH